MPSFTVVIASLLFSHCLTTQGRAETVSYIIPDNDLQKHCAFDLNGYVYNLCPLMGLTRVVEVPEEMSVELQDWRSGSGRYVLALGGLGKENNLPGCHEGTQLCFTRLHEPGFHFIPIIQKGESTLILEVDGNFDQDPPQLQITFRGAKKDVDVVFTCSEVDDVRLINVRRDTLRFMWASRNGCPRNSTRRRRKSKSTLNTWTAEEEPNGSEDHEGDEKLLPSDSRKARTGIALVIASIVLTVVCGSALASSARARHFVVGHLRSTSYAVVPVLAEVGFTLGQSFTSLRSKALSVGGRFRPGDDNLVRWAQEDMALDSDIMVNGSHGAYHLDEESWNGSNEYIPLATSPKFGTRGRIQSYGTIPEAEVATSEERGVMSRMRRYLKI